MALGNRVRAKGGGWDVRCPHHPRAKTNGYVPEHVLVAEEAMGKPLPSKAVVHHVNGDPSDNRPQNLVVCQDQGFHMLLHRRQRALEACGNPGWLLCPICGKHDAPENLYVHIGARLNARHRECHARVMREKRKR